MKQRKFSEFSLLQHLPRDTSRFSSASEMYNFVVFGASGVGKSAIIDRLVNNDFCDNYLPTISEVYDRRIVPRDSKHEVQVRLFDTCGSQSFPAMERLTINQGQAFIVVYSVDSAKSLTAAKTYLDKIMDVKKGSSNTPCILLANKSDRTDREVTFEHGLQTAVSYRCAFVETSAKLDTNIDDLLYSLLKKLHKLEYLEYVREKKACKEKRRQHRSSSLMNIFGPLRTSCSMDSLASV